MTKQEIFLMTIRTMILSNLFSERQSDKWMLWRAHEGHQALIYLSKALDVVDSIPKEMRSSEAVDQFAEVYNRDYFLSLMNSVNFDSKQNAFLKSNPWLKSKPLKCSAAIKKSRFIFVVDTVLSAYYYGVLENEREYLFEEISSTDGIIGYLRDAVEYSEKIPGNMSVIDAARDFCRYFIFKEILEEPKWFK